MDYEKIRLNAKRFEALTSLKVEEFDDLLNHFSVKWDRYYRYNTLEGKKRKHPRRQEHGNSLLQGTALKLFFLLVFLKNNHLQQSIGASFNISQPKVSKIIRVLLEVLADTLKSMGLTPHREGLDLAKLLENHPDKVFSYDGTERRIQRNEDQEEEYSGKKHTHNIKNNLLCDDNQYIHYLSPTETGSTHDMTIAKEHPILLPQNSVLRQDLGFIGHVPQENITIEIPHKKPKKQELPFAKKLYNKMLAATRVVVEHANSGLKRLHILKYTIRIHAHQFRDLVMLIGCALHNFRVKSDYRSYQAPL